MKEVLVRARVENGFLDKLKKVWTIAQPSILKDRESNQPIPLYSGMTMKQTDAESSSA